jgi:hypothetical protein
VNPLPFWAGVTLLGVGVVDLLWTTLWVRGGAGPLTTHLMTWTWRPLRRVGEHVPRLRTVTGPVVLVISILTWIALLWVGWTLVFAGAEDALVDTVAAGPIGWVERFYFVGYSMFTMGNGDFVLRDGPWQVATALMTASGMLFVTLIITYVLSVLDAVTQKRSFARNVSGLGADGVSLVERTWSGDGFEGVDLPLNSITTQLNELTANHKAYPVLHYFYTDERDAAAVVSVATLDDALAVWQGATPEEHRPTTPVLVNARSSVQSYTDTVRRFAGPSDDLPPEPDLDVLRAADIPTVSDEAFGAALDELDEQRRVVHGVVRARARRWPRPNSG